MPENERRRGFLGRTVRQRSVRGELAVIACAVFVVFAVGAVAVSMLALDRAKAASRNDAAFTAKVAADAIDGEVSAALASVSGAAASAAVVNALSKAPGPCDLQFSLTSFGEAHLDLVSPQGQVVCSSATGAWKQHNALSGSAWLATLSGGQNIVVSAYYADPVTGHLSVAAAARVVDPSGRLAGFVAAVLPLEDTADDLAATLGGPRHYKFAIVAADAALLSAPGTSASELMVGSTPADWFGSQSVSAFVPLDSTGWQIGAGLSKSASLGNTRTTLGWALGVGVATLLLMFALIVVINRRIARPLARLTSSMSKAHHNAAVMPVLEGPKEITRLREEFRELMQARDAYQERLENHALRDPLTGLANRALLTDRLAQALTNGGVAGQIVTVLVIDLDRFKLVNDSFGHLAGDRVLTEVATRLLETARPADTVARLAGDEFGVLCQSMASLADVSEFATALSDIIEFPITVDDATVTMTASIGIVHADAESTPEGLLRDGNIAMYEAKHLGRARRHVFDRPLQVKASSKLVIENELRDAAERQELWVAYQPIVTVTGGSCVGVESLLRWNHPIAGSVPPSDFIPVAEESGLIVALGGFVLNGVCRQLQDWRRGNLDVRAAVNVSGRQLVDNHLLRQVTDALTDYDVDPANLCLELTESLLMVDSARSARELRELKRLGVQISIDDFGTGYSSLAYLHRFPVDELKIDRAFIHDLATDSSTRTLVQAIIVMSHALGLTVVAEGVETKEQLDVLEGLECDFAQGYLFARPERPSSIVAFMENNIVHRWRSV